jgi:hypothetical protein
VTVVASVTERVPETRTRATTSSTCHCQHLLGFKFVSDDRRLLLIYGANSLNATRYSPWLATVHFCSILARRPFHWGLILICGASFELRAHSRTGTASPAGASALTQPVSIETPPNLYKACALRCVLHSHPIALHHHADFR